MTALRRSAPRKAAKAVLGRVLRVTLIAAWVFAGPAPVAYAATPGYYVAGGGSGGGGGGDYPYDYARTPNGASGSGTSDAVTGTAGDDVIFGDGSGGGGGGSAFRNGWGGAAGGGADTIDGDAGDDIVFGDGFTGGARSGANGGAGGFGGGGGGGGAYNTNGNGGTGGILGGGGGSHSGSTTGTSLWGGLSGGIASKPASGTSSDDNLWGGNAATPTAGTGWFSEQSLGGTGYNSFGAGGGAGFGGANSDYQWIASGVRRYANGGQPQWNGGMSGTDQQVRYSDSTGALWSYVSGQRANIFSTTTGTVYGVGAGADTIDGGPGSDQLFGCGGNDTFVFDRDEAGVNDTDTVCDFNRLGESDKLNLYLSGRLVRSGELSSILASQTQPSDHSDRTIVFSDGGSHSVTVVVKSMGRNLSSSDFNTLANSAPSVTTSSVADITSATASCGGSVVDDGGTTVTARGVCWSTSANPTVSGSKTTDASGTGSYSSSITGLSPHTRYHVRAYATNSVGTSYGDDVSFYYDDAAPVTTASGLATNTVSGWTEASATVSLSATDPLSGVAYTQYAVDGGAWTTYTVDVSIGGTDGPHPVLYRSADQSGNVESTNTGYVNIDSVVPTLSVDSPSGWQVSSPVTVTASAEDTMSGLAAIRYSENEGAATTYTAGVPVSTQGTTTLSFAALDSAGNVSATQTVTVRLDSVAPSTIASGLAEAPGTWRTSALLVSLLATDAASGVGATTFTVDAGGGQLYTAPVPVTGEGTHTVTYASADLAGNVESTHTGYVCIDETAPRTTDDHTSTYTGSATIHLSAVDTMSGPDYTAYSLDSTAVAHGTTVTVSAVGTHTLEYASTDEAGNVESTHTITFAVAKTSYSTNLKLSGAWSVRRLATYTLGVRIVPSEATGTVALKYQRRVSGTWRTIKKASVTLAGGTVSYRCRFGRAGTWRVIATYGGSTTATAIYGATSRTRALTVR